jgi:anti-sigma factor RsiW
LAEYDISCTRLSELTTDYVEGALDERLRTTFEQHAVLCDPCFVHLEQLRATMRILNQLPSPRQEETVALIAELGADGG